MKVCLVTAEYPPQQGGVGDYTRELAAALRQRGVDAVVLTGGPVGSDGGCAAVPVERRISSWGWRLWGALERALGALAPDVVHVQYQAAAYGLHPAVNLWPRLSRWRGVTVVTFHDLRVPYLFPKAGHLRFRAVVELARSAARAVVTNAEDQATLAPHLAQPPALIPIGSNIHPEAPPGYDRAAWRMQAGAHETTTVLAYFGFLNESKGGEELVRALALLRQQGLDVRLWMVGGQVGHSDPTNRAYLSRLRELIAQLGLEPFVRWTGFTVAQEVSANLLAADLCVLPYRDGASFRRGSLMAALAHGLPVVSTWPRVPLSGLVDGENVALVPPGDVGALASRIAALLADAAARRRLGEGARALSAHFGWDSIAARTCEVYHEVLRSHLGA
ncbi:MAG: glycosyltransferase family 4 protein [Anaerolineae bacterium]|nr:glycosyltransferase family 4 protein [Anaerolineae bacterium]